MWILGALWRPGTTEPPERAMCPKQSQLCLGTEGLCPPAYPWQLTSQKWPDWCGHLSDNFSETKLITWQSCLSRWVQFFSLCSWICMRSCGSVAIARILWKSRNNLLSSLSFFNCFMCSLCLILGSSEPPLQKRSHMAHWSSVVPGGLV